MGRRLVVVVSMIALGGCALPAASQARVRQVGRSVCAQASHTEGAAPPVGGAPGCRSELSTSDGTWQQAYDLNLCGPCAFVYDARTTASERAAGRSDACCYEPQSPPPPPPPPS